MGMARAISQFNAKAIAKEKQIVYLSCAFARFLWFIGVVNNRPFSKCLAYFSFHVTPPEQSLLLRESRSNRHLRQSSVFQGFKAVEIICSKEPSTTFSLATRFCILS